MKAIQKPHSAIIPSTILYLDDIEQIITLLNQVSGNVSISDREFEYDSLENFVKKVGNSPTNLTISCRNPSVSVRFDRRESITASWLYAEAYHEDAETTFLKLRELLYRRLNWANHIFRLDIALVLFIVVFLIIPLLLSGILSQWIQDKSTMIVLLGSVFIYWILAFVLNTGLLYSIKLIKRHEKQSFLQQNSGAIILLVIGAAIGEVIRWLAAFFLK
jgi:hypothetical protein